MNAPSRPGHIALALVLTQLAALAAGCDGSDAHPASGDAIVEVFETFPDASVEGADATVDATDATADASNSGALTPGEVRYRLDWDHTRLEATPEGTWATTTDRGYRVTLTRGWLTSYQMSMVPCWLIEGTGARIAPGDDTGRSPLHRLWSLIGGVAHAGHDDEPDPSLIDASRVEVLADLASSAFGAVRVPAETYCKTHYVAARSDDDTTGMPSGIDYDRITMHLEGTWALADGTPTAFTVRTALAAGKNLALLPVGGVEGDDLRLDPSTGGFEVTVYRRPGGWFDGIDFANIADEEAIDRAVLQNLTRHLWLEVRF